MVWARRVLGVRETMFDPRSDRGPQLTIWEKSREAAESRLKRQNLFSTVWGGSSRTSTGGESRKSNGTESPRCPRGSRFLQGKKTSGLKKESAQGVGKSRYPSVRKKNGRGNQTAKKSFFKSARRHQRGEPTNLLEMRVWVRGGRNKRNLGHLVRGGSHASGAIFTSPGGEKG